MPPFLFHSTLQHADSSTHRRERLSGTYHMSREPLPLYLHIILGSLPENKHMLCILITCCFYHVHTLKHLLSILQLMHSVLYSPVGQYAANQSLIFNAQLDTNHLHSCSAKTKTGSCTQADKQRHDIQTNRNHFWANQSHAFPVTGCMLWAISLKQQVHKHTNACHSIVVRTRINLMYSLRYV